jgi:hypothetical protein
MKGIAYCLALGVVMTTGSSAWSQQQKKAAETLPGPGPISLKIFLDHQELTSGSALVLTVTMINATDERHCYKMFPGNAKDNFEPEVVRANGDKVAMVSAKESHSLKTKESKTECLQGRAILSQSMRLDELFDVKRADTYRVRVNRSLEKKAGQTDSGQEKPEDKAYSNVLSFRILP